MDKEILCLKLTNEEKQRLALIKENRRDKLNQHDMDQMEFDEKRIEAAAESIDSYYENLAIERNQ